MSKPSGWRVYRQRYSPYQRATDPALPKRPEELEQFAETSRGPVNRALFDQGLIEYSEQGQIVVNRSEVQAQARGYVKYTQDATYSRDYLVSSYREATPGADKINKAAAERGLNKHEAAKAKAILLAADLGKVNLTDAQRQRLERVAAGDYLNLVYNQYASGSRGTVAPKKRERRASLDSTEAAADERRRVFYTEVMRSRGKRRAA
jgi:hypothetical protein